MESVKVIASAPMKEAIVPSKDPSHLTFLEEEAVPNKRLRKHSSNADKNANALFIDRID